MKKKTLALLLAISCALSTAACGASEAEEAEAPLSRANEAREGLEKEFSEEEDDEEVEEEPEVEEAPEEEEPEEDEKETPKVSAMSGELSDDLYDFQISIDGVVYQFPMWYSDFEALGWEYDGDNTQTLSSNQYTAVEIWEKDGYEVYTRFANLSMNAAPYAESMVAGITLEDYHLEDCDWEILLPGGIQYGVSNTDDIKEAYGEPSRDYDGDLYYMMAYQMDNYREIELYVYKEENALLKIDLQNLVELEGADNSIDETVPELVERYEAPETLGDDFYAYTAQLEGVVYSLPCPVSVLLDNGFTIDTANSDSEVAAGRSGWVDLRYNNQTLHTMVENYADYATIVENCFVVSMKSSAYGPKFDLVIPGGIKVGDSEDAVKKAVASFNCETETSDSGYTYYEIYDPDGSSLDSYIIVVEDGSVSSIEVRNSEEPEY
ncbi:MAG: hypothetical protein K2J99_03450 [Lachnospiraceae bacterium]|nr:hypothetical protein [Lachnospiraceae bacterium]